MGHRVKCFYCGHTFDRDKEPFVPIEGKKRYAHKLCYDRARSAEQENEENKIQLENYIKELFNYKTLPEPVNRQIREYLIDKNYTYKGILKSLKYFYEIKNGDKEKAHGRIGIVPYVYEDAHNYYLALFETKEKNEQVVISDYVLPQKVICIRDPQRTPMTGKRKLFSFLDEEENE